MLQPLLRPAAAAANDRLRGASPLALPAPPVLDLDFVGRPSLQYPGLPPITFARAGTATRFNAAGLLETVAADAPRFDHHPLTGARLGLLIEEARTNLVLRAEDFAHASWTKDNATAGGASTAPDGAASAQALAEDSTTGQHRARQNGVAFAAGATLAVSCFLKAAGRGFATLQFGAANGFRACFNLAAGTLASGFAGASFGTGSFVSAGVQRLPNGWLRCWVVGKEDAAATSGEAYLNIVRAAAYTDSYAGDGASGILAWGYQVEAGAFPTSYVKTAGATVTRAADVASLALLASWFSPVEGTLLAEASIPILKEATAAHLLAELHDGTANNRIVLQVANTADKPTRCLVRSGGVDQADINDGTSWLPNTIGRAALTYKANNFAVMSRGGGPNLDTLGEVPANLTKLQIGANFGPAGFLCGHLVRVAYLPQQIPTALLQALTH